MKVLIQRVTSASVTVDSEVIGAIEKGYFKEEGLTVNLITTPGVMRNVS